MSKEPNKSLAYQEKVREALKTIVEKAINSHFPEDHLLPHLKKAQLDFKKELGTGIQDNRTKVEQLISSVETKKNLKAGTELRKILEKESLLGFLEEEILRDGKQKGFLPEDLQVVEGSALEILTQEKLNFDKNLAAQPEKMQKNFQTTLKDLGCDLLNRRADFQDNLMEMERQKRVFDGESSVPSFKTSSNLPRGSFLVFSEEEVRHESLNDKHYFWLLKAINALSAASQEPNSTYEDFVREFSQRESFSDPKKFLQNSYLDGELPPQKKYFKDSCDEWFVNDMCKKYPTAYAYASDCTMKDLPITKKSWTSRGTIGLPVQGSPFLRQSAIATGFIDYEKLSLVGEMLLNPDLILNIPGQIVPTIPELFFGLDKKTFAGFLSELDEEYKKNLPHEASEVSEVDHYFSYLSKLLFEAAAKHLDLPYSNVDDLFASKKEHEEPRDYSQGIYSIINEYVMNEREAHRILEREIRSEEPSPNAMRRKFHDAKEFAEQAFSGRPSTRRSKEIKDAQSFATQPFLGLSDPRILD